ncbi:hypothetical protein GEMRC1_004208 [Eukaryota sp. GEM-RC1]
MNQDFGAKLRHALTALRTANQPPPAPPVYPSTPDTLPPSTPEQSIPPAPKPVSPASNPTPSVASHSAPVSTRAPSRDPSPINQYSDKPSSSYSFATSAVGHESYTKPNSLNFQVQALIARLDAVERLIRRKTRLRAEEYSLLDSFDESLSTLTSSVTLLAQSDMIDRDQLQQFYKQELEYLLELSRLKHQFILKEVNEKSQQNSIKMSGKPPVKSRTNSAIEEAPVKVDKKEHLFLILDSIAPIQDLSKLFFHW